MGFAEFVSAPRSPQVIGYSASAVLIMLSLILWRVRSSKQRTAVDLPVYHVPMGANAARVLEEAHEEVRRAWPLPRYESNPKHFHKLPVPRYPICLVPARAGCSDPTYFRD
jgi:hypothetical protein